MSPNLHLFNNLHSLKGIKVILQLIIIGYYSAIFQGNKYLLPNKIICLLEAGVKITSSFLRYLKNPIGIVTHLQMWRPKNNIDIFFHFDSNFNPCMGQLESETFKVFYFPCWFWFLLSMAFEKLEKSVFPDLHCFLFFFSGFFFFFPFGKYSSTSNLYLVEEKPTWLFL